MLMNNWSRWIYDHIFNNVYLKERQEGLYHIFTDEISETFEVYKRTDLGTGEIQYKSVLKKITKKTVHRATLRY
jgi:hypothetical protein